MASGHAGHVTEWQSVMTDVAGGIRWRAWSLGVVLPVLLLVLATLPPLVHMEWRILLMHSFSAVCHQIVERSFHIGGVPLAVCHRCYGIYWGLLLGPFVYLVVQRWERHWWKHSRSLVIWGLVPLAIDWGLGVLGLWSNTLGSRTATGAVFGLIAGLMVAHAVTRSPRARAPGSVSVGAGATSDQYLSRVPQAP